MAKENTIHKFIGQSTTLYSYEELKKYFGDLADSLSDGYTLTTEDYYVKGPFIKYGFLDLTFSNHEGAYLRIFAESDEVGLMNKELDVDQMRRSFAGQLSNFDALFPVTVKVHDCCVTDDPRVWSDKYFYT